MRPRSAVLGTVTHPQQGHRAACASLPGALLTRTSGTLTVYELPQFYFPFLGSPPGTHWPGCAWDGVAWQGGASRREKIGSYLDGGGAALLVLALAQQAIGLHVTARHRHRLHNVQAVAAKQRNRKSATGHGKNNVLWNNTGLTFSVFAMRLITLIWF